MNSTRETGSVLVVGAGNVGTALGSNLITQGRDVTFAVRDLGTDLPAGATPVAIDGAGGSAELVVLAVPFDVVPDVVPRLGLQPETVLVDATNPFGRPLPEGVGSGAEVVRRSAGKGVEVVKAFNVLGAEHMADPSLPDGSRPLLPVAGDDPGARARVVGLATELGFDAVDVGGLESAHLLEEAARYWGLLAYGGGRGRGVVLVAHQR
jgi:predicted dinucleotide-binding enzyme